MLGKSSQGTGTTVDARDTDGHDGDENDNVHEVIETLKTGILSSKHEWRGTISVWVLSVEQTLVLGADQETDEGKTEDIEPEMLLDGCLAVTVRVYSQGNSPEDLLDGSWEGLGWVLGLSSGKTDKLSSGESEGCNDEDGAESTESVLERTWVVPKTGTPVLAVTSTLWPTTANENESDEHEDDCGAKLEDSCEELLLGVSKSTEDVGNDDEDPENCNPHSNAGIFVPIRNREGYDCQFKW